MMEASDIDQVSIIITSRGGIESEQAKNELQQEFISTSSRIKRYLHVAVLDNKILGFCRLVDFKNFSKDSSMPNGAFLMGVVILPEYRRQGIADALTSHRIQFCEDHSLPLYYFTSTLNKASIKLHEKYGFTEIRRAEKFMGMAMDGGEGILFKKCI
jgi:ribosomal protein S18 acetylase RimI-like enzyme